MELPLRNRKGDIVGRALVSPEDYDKVKGFRWYGQTYAKGTINKKPTTMHQHLMGKAPKGMVIDHINGNGLDNRRENLRFASLSLNSQNKKVNKDNTSSKYIGVRKEGSKWRAVCVRTHVGTYDTELEATRMHDTFALVHFSGHGKTNGLVTYEEVKHLKIEDIITKPVERSLPKHIYRSETGKYYTQTSYKRTRFSSPHFDTVNEALAHLAIFQEKINEMKDAENTAHHGKQVTKDDQGQTVIHIKDKNGNLVLNCIVDEDRWHELSKYTWTLGTNNYINGFVNGKTVKMHRYIMKAPENSIVDHINGVKYDNRKCNLRSSDPVLNGHNKVKKPGTSSNFFGVSKSENKWAAYVSKGYKRYHLGSYDTEVEAAIAYNIKTSELYGAHANLNDIENEMVAKYRDSVISNIGKVQQKQETPQASKYRGVHIINGKWGVKVFHKKKEYFLGYFDNELDAAVAYNAKAIEIHGHEWPFLNKLDESAV